MVTSERSGWLRFQPSHPWFRSAANHSRLGAEPEAVFRYRPRRPSVPPQSSGKLALTD